MFTKDKRLEMEAQITKRADLAMTLLFYAFLVVAMVLATETFATVSAPPGQSQGQDQGQLQGQGQAQSNQVGIGIGVDTRAAAAAFAGGGAGGSALATGGNSTAGGAVSNNSMTINQSSVPGDVKIRNVPDVTAPNVYPTSPCMGSTSVGGSGVGFGISVGSSWKDDECGIRETSRSFQALKLPEDALAVLCSSQYAKAAPSCEARK